jgi:uncharacterized GH25 family protein
MRRWLSLLAGIAAIGAPALASAHGIWIAPRAGDLAVIYGHGAEDDAYKPEKLTSAVGLTASGERREVPLTRTQKNVLLAPPEDVVALVSAFDNGFWTEGPDGVWKNLAKSEVPGAKQAGRYLKYNIHVLRRLPGAMAPTGAALEIVPLEDPIGKKPGEPLEVQVLLRGKPLAGVALIADYVNQSHGKTAELTDAEGRIDVEVRNDGLNVIGVSFEEPTPGDADADKVGHFATLSFALPHSE